MLKSTYMRLRLLLIIPAVVLGLILSASSLHAEEKNAIQKMRDDFCDARSGDVINLQTWYSGKCVKGDVKATDPEAIGFSDIVLLDIYTRLAGEEDAGLLDTIKDMVDANGNPHPVYGNGLIGGVNSILYQVVSTPPASSTEYLAYLNNNLSKHKLVQPAYAQNTGYGFKALSPVLPIWRAFRNVSYGLFVIAFILYGFMIMFRRKISPQAVINIQMAIPKLVMVLLVITFSYAIAGFLIDLMYVLLQVFFAVLIANDMVADSMIGSWGLGDVSVMKILSRMMIHFTVGGLLEKIIAAVTGIPTELVGASALVLTYFFSAAMIGVFLILFIIFLFAILYTLFKILWLLIEAYVKILLGIIFSPLILLQDLIPKRTSTLNDWLLGLVSNISMFFTAIAMFTFSFIFIGKLKPYGYGDIFEGWGATAVAGRIFAINDFALPNTDGELWNAPLLFGFGNAENTLALIGIGFFFMTPKIMSVVRDSIKKSTLGLGGELMAPLEFGYYVNYASTQPGSLFRKGVRGLFKASGGTGTRLGRGIAGVDVAHDKQTQGLTRFKPAKDPWTGKAIGRP